MHQQCSLATKQLQGCFGLSLGRVRGGSPSDPEKQGRSATFSAAIKNGVSTKLEKQTLQFFPIRKMGLRYKLMSAWCIPCPDHIIVEHNQVAPLGPKPGFCKFDGLGLGSAC